MTDRAALAALTAEVVACHRCPRLVEWRERVAREKVARCKSGVETDAECQEAGSALAHETKPTPIGTYQN